MIGRWPALPLKRYLSRNDGGVWGVDPSGLDDSIVLRSTEQTSDGQWRLVDPAVRSLTKSERSRFRLMKGDIVVTKSSGSPSHIGKATIVDEGVAALGATYSNFMQRLRVTAELRPRFLWYLFLSRFVRDQLALTSTTTTGLANLTASTLGRLLVPVPSLSDQDAVIALLDRETVEIDGFIADQKRLIALLAERRAATISHATTKGLDPTVPLKDSGVEWIGDVPRDWQVMPVRSIVRVLESGTSVNAADWPAGPGEIGVLKTSCVYSGEFDPSENKKVDAADLGRVSCPVRRGSVIVSRMNTPALVGAAGLVREEAPGLFLPDRLWQLQVEGDPRFFHYWTQSKSYRSQVSLAAEGTSSSMLNIGQRDLLSMKIAVPPSMAIAQILDQLDGQVARFEAAIADAREAIMLSRERRAALISAAVTGKIDVRGA